ncbi:hypothetical protein BuS5_03520 [Desulfosarcina sp. BuS5]|uniref:DUF1844 domain-containing protein n=1 Tax=Desulfosarcina sp. BuS5 TaxID=933262 RepID=UPI00048662A8|nr:DUF1844 domain-containing protein [Desulfosarcina sp. BuS5]WDN90549.1 hypothetical protein BuS5_03520 [Desulfosarcina sp. BuS5]
MSDEKGFVLKGDKSAENQKDVMPGIDFSTFMMSLNASVLVNFGIMDDPVTGEKSKNLVMGKQTIDVLSMLQEKTRGNLTPEEDNLLKHLLYELRILYLKQQ